MYAALGGVKFSGAARCSTFNSTFVLPFLSRPTSTSPRAAGTDSAAVSGNFFALPTVVRTVSPTNAKTTYGFMKTPFARSNCDRYLKLEGRLEGFRSANLLVVHDRQRLSRLP